MYTDLVGPAIMTSWSDSGGGGAEFVEWFGVNQSNSLFSEESFQSLIDSASFQKKKKRFITIPIYLQMMNYDTGDVSLHCNAIVIDPVSKLVLRYDPNGFLATGPKSKGHRGLCHCKNVIISKDIIYSPLTFLFEIDNFGFVTFLCFGFCKKKKRDLNPTDLKLMVHFSKKKIQEIK